MAVIRQFTLRLEEQEDEAMVILKELTGENTDTGAIKNCIRNYNELNNRYMAEKAKKNHVDNLYQELKQKVELYFSTSEEIKKILKDGKK